MHEARVGNPPREAEGVASAVEGKLRSDLCGLRMAIAGCRRCGGGGGIPGCGEPGMELFLLAGRPGPGASEGNPWGIWRNVILGGAGEEWGWSPEDIYFSTALRCPFPKVTGAEVRRCANMLAEELFIVGPRMVLVSGKIAAAALRGALGPEVPGNPRAGDRFRLFGISFLFNLDIARIGSDKEAARIFWSVLREKG